jgi:hypothetical protein
MENWERPEEREGAYKKRKKIPTAGLNRRDQVTATKSWPSSLRKERNRGRLPGGSTYWVEYTQIAPSDHRSTKSADGRVATGAAWLKGRNSQGEREEQNILTGKEKKKNILDTHRPSHGRLMCYHEVPPLRESKPRRTFFTNSARKSLHRPSTHQERLFVKGLLKVFGVEMSL